MKRRRWLGAAAVGLLGCGHSEQFITSIPPVGPFSTGTDIRLTVNGEQDYWPTWTADGHGILYAFVNPVSPGIPADRHRCLGILPATGGTRLWQWCDNRATQSDSASSFTAYALNTDGRLLYAEAIGPANAVAIPSRVTLWLADTAAPLNRTAVFTLPANVGVPVTWLSDITWTGPNSFLALGQVLGFFPHCLVCSATDTLFADSTLAGGIAAASGTLLAGTITNGQASMQAVPGTQGAIGYSLAENGASIVFIHRDDTRLFKVAAAGGVATVVATVTFPGPELLGVSCKGSTCLVADDPVRPSYGGGTQPVFPSAGTGPRELQSVSLSTGTVLLLRNLGSSSALPILTVPRISPVNGDVVVQLGGVWGHLQTNTGGGASDLHLYPGLVP